MSACPVTGPFQGPAPLAFLHRKLESLDEKNAVLRGKLVDQASASDGAAACRRHIECSRVCPQNVAPARRIQQLRTLLDRM
jgi:succinate dehydrogenase / fumarate reductase iron-sulfur subunit